jgi:predicted nucleic acid-binding protein
MLWQKKLTFRGGRTTATASYSEIKVDANIVFSALLNTNGKIGDLLINSNKYFTFIAPDFLRIGIKNHYSKIVKVSGLSLKQVQEAEFQIYKDVRFISEEQIQSSTWIEAEKLVFNVDP